MIRVVSSLSQLNFILKQAKFWTLLNKLFETKSQTWNKLKLFKKANYLIISQQFQGEPFKRGQLCHIWPRNGQLDNPAYFYWTIDIWHVHVPGFSFSVSLSLSLSLSLFFRSTSTWLQSHSFRYLVMHIASISLSQSLSLVSIYKVIYLHRNVYKKMATLSLCIDFEQITEIMCSAKCTASSFTYFINLQWIKEWKGYSFLQRGIWLATGKINPFSSWLQNAFCSFFTIFSCWKNFFRTWEWWSFTSCWT